MPASKERRSFKRYTYKTPVEIRYENTGEIHHGDMENYSSKGMCIATSEKFKMDNNVYIRMKEYHPGRRGVNSYEWYGGRVCWAGRENKNDMKFVMGIQFPYPMIY
ncbi:PilZ domain-containing protein [Desulfoplanes sp.]